MKERNRTFDTGDVNLVAACMTVGIPLNYVQPCSLIMRDNGENYGRFHLNLISIHGDYHADSIADWWDSPSSCNDAIFSQLMQFIKAGIKAKCSNASDWLEFAINHLTESGITVHPANIRAIPDHIQRDPNSISNHILAYVYNRDHAFRIFQNAKRSIMITRNKNDHACIDTNLPRHQQKELLARLEG